MTKCIMKHYRETTHGDTYTIEFRQEDDASPWSIYCHRYPGQDRPRGHYGHLNGDGELAVNPSLMPLTLERAIAVARLFMETHTKLFHLDTRQKGS